MPTGGMENPSSSLGIEGDFNLGLDFGSRSSHHPKSAASARRQPTLLELREQANWGSRTAPTLLELRNQANRTAQTDEANVDLYVLPNLVPEGKKKGVKSFSLKDIYLENLEKMEGIGMSKKSSRHEQPYSKQHHVPKQENQESLCGMEKFNSEKYAKFAYVFGATANGSDAESDAGLKPNLVKGDSNKGSHLNFTCNAPEKTEQGFNSSTDAVHEACEKWLLRGHRAYREYNISEAELYYTEGINSVPSNETTSRSSIIKLLVLCYSNRAAARIFLKRIREALADCLKAADLDPNYVRADLRAASCHLLLGETENALMYSTKFLGTVSLDLDIIDGANQLQRNAQRVIELTNLSAQLLKQKEAFSALKAIAEALSISLYDEKLLQMKAEALLILRRYEKAIELWNEALHSGKYADPVEHYSKALSNMSSNVEIESRAFAAKCFCHRAAAHHALGQIADAIADCSLAMALDENYIEAISRRATLHKIIRDYGQAACDLRRLISILEKQPNLDKWREARRQLSSLEEEAAQRENMPLDFYLILGVKPSDSKSHVRKAYLNAAHRHHPDKTALFLANNIERGDIEGRPWKEIAEQVRKDANRLFKMIGEAYAVLSNPAERSKVECCPSRTCFLDNIDPTKIEGSKSKEESGAN
ncbi:hypothetical protein CCACVL1_29157 [Corchorus capsularis]|uniref:J domain-containing protein n=1 Tax=Corchorus capsularis TaxID=210143 RepID=A0A1R3G3I4_COCAP|nr:hypothetical protein CCACVL1_29157 [Corchorus capsularis]